MQMGRRVRARIRRSHRSLRLSCLLAYLVHRQPKQKAHQSRPSLSPSVARRRILVGRPQRSPLAQASSAVVTQPLRLPPRLTLPRQTTPLHTEPLRTTRPNGRATNTASSAPSCTSTPTCARTCGSHTSPLIRRVRVRASRARRAPAREGRRRVFIGSLSRRVRRRRPRRNVRRGRCRRIGIGTGSGRGMAGR